MIVKDYKIYNGIFAANDLVLLLDFLLSSKLLEMDIAHSISNIY